MERSGHTARSRTFSGDLGRCSSPCARKAAITRSRRISTDQTGESRLDRNAKKFFLTLHKAGDPRHRIEAAY